MKYYTGTWYYYFYQFVHTYVLNKEIYSMDEVSNWVNKYSLWSADKIFPVSEQSDKACVFDHLLNPADKLNNVNLDDILVLTPRHGFIIPESVRHGHIYLFIIRHNKKAGIKMGHS